jgi:hippurate hydrolase
MTKFHAVVPLIAMLASSALAADSTQDVGLVVPELATIQPGLEALYRDLHQHPELAFHEVRTADTLATRLKALGYEVTTGVGKTGIVAILRNGPGPVIMLRTELDALPVEEKTGLAFASKATMRNDAGVTVPLAHACGHDLHMAGWYGTATVMAGRRDRWHGTLMLVGQPAEEILGGASAMLADGLFSKFPTPESVIGQDFSALPQTRLK